MSSGLNSASAVFGSTPSLSLTQMVESTSNSGKAFFDCVSLLVMYSAPLPIREPNVAAIFQVCSPDLGNHTRIRSPGFQPLSSAVLASTITSSSGNSVIFGVRSSMAAIWKMAVRSTPMTKSDSPTGTPLSVSPRVACSSFAPLLSSSVAWLKRMGLMRSTSGWSSKNCRGSGPSPAKPVPESTTRSTSAS